MGKYQGQGAPYEIGTVDPKTGDYLRYFDIPAQAQIPPAGPFDRVSPDLRRVAGIGSDSSGAMVAGWYNTDQSFTPASPAPASDPFSPATEYTAPKFDYQGRFYYTVITRGSGAKQYFRLAPGATSNPEQLDFKYVEFQGPTMFPNGQQSQSCMVPDDIYSFIAPDQYLIADSGPNTTNDSMIYRGSIAELNNNPDAYNCFENDKVTRKPLLPETNIVSVSQPVATRDKASVAFFHNKTDLYVVDINGGQPTKVPGTWRPYQLLEWR